MFRTAVSHEARGTKDACIVHIDNAEAADDIRLDLWLKTDADYAKFQAALLSQEFFKPESISSLKYEIQAPPEPLPPVVILTDCARHANSPARSGKTGGASTAPALSVKLQHQRVDKDEDITYENMHIIPATLLADDRKLTCRWLFLSGSANFHKWYDGPRKAPHIQVTAVREAEPVDEETESVFTLTVDLSKVGKSVAIQKLDSSVDLPASHPGYRTRVSLPAAQADSFEQAIAWRAACVQRAWECIDGGQEINTNDAGNQGWWRCVDLPDDLKSAITKAKFDDEGPDDDEE